jgi:hypothetical protein
MLNQTTPQKKRPETRQSGQFVVVLVYAETTRKNKTDIFQALANFSDGYQQSLVIFHGKNYFKIMLIILGIKHKYCDEPSPRD